VAREKREIPCLSRVQARWRRHGTGRDKTSVIISDQPSSAVAIGRAAPRSKGLLELEELEGVKLGSGRVHNFVFTVANFVFLSKFDFHTFEFETEITNFPDRNSYPGVHRKRKKSPKFRSFRPKR